MKIVFVSAKRTPFGSFGGTLSGLTATDLATQATAAAITQGGLSPQSIDQVIFGSALHTSPDAIYLARHVALRSGMNESVPAVTVNRLCGSGFEAVLDGARRLRSREANAVIVGGAESMSQAPFVTRGLRFGVKMNHQPLEDTLISGLFDTYAQMTMSETAEDLAVQYGITREQCDRFALRSHHNAHHAAEAGHFLDEIAPIEHGDGKKRVHLDRDEHIRPNCSFEALSQLRPAFKPNGVLTAGNASGMADGACALVMATEDFARDRQLPVLGYFIDGIAIGCNPRLMGLGPVPVARVLMSRHQLDWAAIKQVEINEAFAPQYLAVQRELQFPEAIANVDGGAISVGHPLGASGARLTAHLLYSLRRAGGGLGFAGACIGGGQGVGVLIKV